MACVTRARVSIVAELCNGCFVIFLLGWTQTTGTESIGWIFEWADVGGNFGFTHSIELPCVRFEGVLDQLLELCNVTIRVSR